MPSFDPGEFTRILRGGNTSVAPADTPSAPPASQLALPQLAPVILSALPSGGQAPVLNEFGRLPRSVQAWAVYAADPSDPQEGEYWVRSDDNTLRWREGGVTYKVAGTAI